MNCIQFNRIKLPLPATQSPSWTGLQPPSNPCQAQVTAFCGLQHTGPFSLLPTCLPSVCTAHTLPPFLQAINQYSFVQNSVFSVKMPKPQPVLSPLSVELATLSQMFAALCCSLSQGFSVWHKYTWTHLLPPSFDSPVMERAVMYVSL